MEDGAVEVKLFDLPEDISKQCITDFLSDYGEVLEVREQMWSDQYTFGGTSTGVWVTRMIVKRNIPSYVTIDGETTYLSYYGQLQSCKHCGENVHNGASCVQNKKLLIQKMTADSTAKQSYANVAKKPAKPRETIPTRSMNQQKTLKPAAPNAVATDTTTIKPVVMSLTPNSALFKKPSTAMPHHQQQQKEKQQQKSSRNNDGGDTDDSLGSNSSRRSRRHVEKKPRYDDGEISPDDVLQK